MRGLFEKDIRIIKNQKKIMLIFAGMGVLLLLSGVEISFILPYMASVMTSVAISTISYDSMDNGNSFLFTLPVRRKDYATEKYFFVCGFGAVSALIVAIACGILLLVRKSEMTAGAFGVETMTCLLIVLLLADLLVPLQIKFGAEKSKIVILATVGILVLGFEIMKNLDQYMQGISSWGRNLWQIISSYKILFGIAGILLVALLTFVSWTISCRVLEKLPSFFTHLYLLIVVFFGWILFRFRQLPLVGTVAAGLFGLNGNAFTNYEINTLLFSHIFFLVVALLAVTPIVKYAGRFLENASKTHPVLAGVNAVVRVAAPPLLMLLSTMALVGNSYNPFLYFQF